MKVTDEMIERAARVHADWEGLDHRGSVREQARAMLEAALSPVEPDEPAQVAAQGQKDKS